MLSKYKDTIKNREIIIDNVRIPTYFPRTMVNLDERYQSYLMNPEKKFRIDGVGERVKAYGKASHNDKFVFCQICGP